VALVLSEPRDRTLTISTARFRDRPHDALGCARGVDPLLWKNLRGQFVRVIRESLSYQTPAQHNPRGWCEGPWLVLVPGEWERFHGLPSRGARVILCAHMIEIVEA
jgi:hypothetical protein